MLIPDRELLARNRPCLEPKRQVAVSTWTCAAFLASSIFSGTLGYQWMWRWTDYNPSLHADNHNIWFYVIMFDHKSSYIIIYDLWLHQLTSIIDPHRATSIPIYPYLCTSLQWVQLSGEHAPQHPNMANPLPISRHLAQENPRDKWGHIDIRWVLGFLLNLRCPAANFYRKHPSGI